MKGKTTRMKLKHPAYGKFQGYLKENGIKLKEVSALLKTSTTMISLKNNGFSDYSMTEINIICDHYNISPNMFRAKDVS